MTVNDILITNDQIDAAFAVVQQESGWSINRIGTVRRMVEAALRTAPSSPASGDTTALPLALLVEEAAEILSRHLAHQYSTNESWMFLRQARDKLREVVVAARKSPANVQTLAADVLERNVTIAKLMDALKLGREAVVESFEFAKSYDDKLLAEARLRDIDDALAAVERPITSGQPQKDNS